MSRLTLAANATESKPVRSFGFIQPTESAVCVACKVQSRRVQFILVITEKYQLSPVFLVYACYGL